MNTLGIILGVVIALIILFVIAGRRFKRLKRKYDRIYQDEYKKRLDRLYKFNVETEEEALINWVEDDKFDGDDTSYMRKQWNPENEPEPEVKESLITWKDLDDLDQMHESHMNY